MQTLPKQQIYEIIKQDYQPLTRTDMAKAEIINEYGMSEKERVVYEAEVSIGLLTLRTLYPTFIGKYGEIQCDILTSEWLKVFAEIEIGLLSKAITRFISSDTKNYFPTPGQVMVFVKEIQEERCKHKGKMIIWKDNVPNLKRYGYVLRTAKIVLLVCFAKAGWRLTVGTSVILKQGFFVNIPKVTSSKVDMGMEHQRQYFAVSISQTAFTKQ